jgi:hypothetical protein
MVGDHKRPFSRRIARGEKQMNGKWPSDGGDGNVLVGRVGDVYEWRNTRGIE